MAGVGRAQGVEEVDGMTYLQGCFLQFIPLTLIFLIVQPHRNKWKAFMLGVLVSVAYIIGTFVK